MAGHFEDFGDDNRFFQTHVRLISIIVCIFPLPSPGVEGNVASCFRMTMSSLGCAAILGPNPWSHRGAEAGRL